MTSPRSAERRAIDWERIRARLTVLEERREIGMTDGQARDILERRARALASPLSTLETREMLSLITFMRDQDAYAVESRFVREVCRLVELTPLPGVAAPISGVSVWRGALLPIIDLRSLVGLPAAPLVERPALIVLGTDETGVSVRITDTAGAVGVLADALGELSAVARSSMRPPTEGLGQSDYVQGMLADGVVMLDAHRILEIIASTSV